MPNKSLGQWLLHYIRKGLIDDSILCYLPTYCLLQNLQHSVITEYYGPRPVEAYDTNLSQRRSGINHPFLLFLLLPLPPAKQRYHHPQTTLLADCISLLLESVNWVIDCSRTFRLGPRP